MDNTYKSLSNLINNKNIVTLKADKETCTLILKRTDYQNKVNNMINEGIAEGKYIEAVDNTHKDLKRFQDFLYRNLYMSDMSNMSNMRICTQNLINKEDFLLQLKLISWTLSMI